MHRPTSHYLKLGALVAIAAMCVAGFLAGFVFSVGLIQSNDKLVHVGFFFLISGAGHIAFPRHAFFVAAAAIGAGLVSEAAQYFSPIHDASLADFLADLVGVAAAFAVALLTRTLFRRIGSSART